MSAPDHPLVANLPGDTLDHVRDLLAVLAAAVQAPEECRPVRFPEGVSLLMYAVDDALGHLARQIAQGWEADDARR